MRLLVISDASFANAQVLRIQLGYLFIMADEWGKANIVHFGSSRCKLVTLFVISSEVHALILAFDFAYIISNRLQAVFHRQIKIEAFVYSKSVFDIIANDGKTT